MDKETWSCARAKVSLLGTETWWYMEDEYALAHKNLLAQSKEIDLLWELHELKGPERESNSGVDEDWQTMNELRTLFLPYQIHTKSELKLHQRLTQEPVKNLWKELPNLNLRPLRYQRSNSAEGKRIPGWWSPQSKSMGGSVSGAEDIDNGLVYSSLGDNYQSDLFPYSSPNFQLTCSWSVDNLDRKKRGLLRRSSRESFPELPKLQKSKKDGDKSLYRKENTQDLDAWIENVFPDRALEFRRMDTAAEFFEAKVHQIQEEEKVPRWLENRRLYRDVLTSRVSRANLLAAEMDKTVEDKFEELEREALEQYTDWRPNTEEEFESLEREAMEQYLDENGLWSFENSEGNAEAPEEMPNQERESSTTPNLTQDETQPKKKKKLKKRKRKKLEERRAKLHHSSSPNE